MADFHDNVIPFRPRQNAVLADYLVPGDATDCVNLATCAETGAFSVVLLAPPNPAETMWDIRDPDEVERLALHLQYLAKLMRESREVET